MNSDRLCVQPIDYPMTKCFMVTSSRPSNCKLIRSDSVPENPFILKFPDIDSSKKVVLKPKTGGLKEIAPKPNGYIKSLTVLPGSSGNIPSLASLSSSRIFVIPCGKVTNHELNISKLKLSETPPASLTEVSFG